MRVSEAIVTLMDGAPNDNLNQSHWAHGLSLWTHCMVIISTGVHPTVGLTPLVILWAIDDRSAREFPRLSQLIAFHATLAPV